MATFLECLDIIAVLVASAVASMKLHHFYGWVTPPLLPLLTVGGKGYPSLKREKRLLERATIARPLVQHTPVALNASVAI